MPTKQKDAKKKAPRTGVVVKKAAKKAPAVKKAPKVAGSALPARTRALPANDSKVTPPRRTRAADGQVAPTRADSAARHAGPQTLSLSAPPAALDTKQGRTWIARCQGHGWTMHTMPARAFAMVRSAISRTALQELLGAPWLEIAAAQKVDPNSPNSLKAAQRLGLVPPPPVRAERVQRVRETTGADGEPVQMTRTLVNDRHLAVPICTLPVGTRFKTPDDTTIGCPGVVSVLRSLGSGSAGIDRTSRLGDYIALSTPVVPLGEVSA